MRRRQTVGWEEEGGAGRRGGGRGEGTPPPRAGWYRRIAERIPVNVSVASTVRTGFSYLHHSSSLALQKHKWTAAEVRGGGDGLCFGGGISTPRIRGGGRVGVGEVECAPASLTDGINPWYPFPPSCRLTVLTHSIPSPLCVCRFLPSSPWATHTRLSHTQLPHFSPHPSSPPHAGSGPHPPGGPPRTRLNTLERLHHSARGSVSDQAGGSAQLL